jgi:hypothetical protein
MPTAPAEPSGVIRQAQRELNRGDAQAALDRLQALPATACNAPLLRLQGLCLLLLDRPQEAQELAAAAQARHASYPYALLQAADLAWHRRDHWPALLASLEAVQQQPRLRNLWSRIAQISTALGAPSPLGAAEASPQEQLRQLLLNQVEQLLANPDDPLQLERLARLLPLLPADLTESQHQLRLADHCRHALEALRALDRLG